MATKKYVDSLKDPTMNKAAREARTAPTLKRRGWEDLADGFPVRMAKAGWGIGSAGNCLINVCPDCLGAAT